MKIFGSVFPFVEPNDESLRMGRFIANYEFLIALLKYAAFDSFHLFCLNPQHLQATADRLLNEPQLNEAERCRIQLFMFSSLQEKLQQQQYHVFHLGGWGYFFSGLAHLRAKAAQPFPITGVIHSLNAREASWDSYKLLKAPVAKYDAVICTSRAGQQVMEKQLQRIAHQEDGPDYVGQLPIIPLGIQGNGLPNRQDARRQLGLEDGSINILYLGRLSPNTKADLYPLLLSFKRLLGQVQQPLRLLLAGGSSPQQLSFHQEMISELKLQDQVHILANISPEQKWQLYAAADISVAPSDNLQETFGISILEAMWAELPLVAAELSGYKELVQHEQTGYLITTTWTDELAIAEMDEIMSNDSLQTLLAQCLVIDLDQFTAALKVLTEQPELRQRMGTAAKEHVRQHYLWPDIINQYCALWDKLAAEAQTAAATPPDHSLFGNHYLETFSHYPSRLLQGDMQLSLTAEGRECLQTGAAPPIYSDVAMLLDHQWLTTAMQTLAKEGPLPLAILLERLGDKNNQGRFSLLWASKYGLLKLET